ncbi:MAG: Fe-S cluster assembly protein SufD [Alphaproteobacteria bacterium]|nr:Fe-S cluster assembly protein SufD [Alphaproteobacteria bacterium]
MATEAYQAQFAAHLPKAGPAWLADLRQAAAARFSAAGLPDRKVEEWRYTNLKPVQEQLFALDTAPVGDTPPTLLQDSHRLVFTNGVLQGSADDLPDGVRLAGMAETMAENPGLLAGHMGKLAQGQELPLPALNQALSRDGYVLAIDPGISVSRPIEILFLSDGGASYPRNLILAGAGAQATVVEHYLGLGGGGYFINAVTEVQAAAGAKLQRYKIQQDAPGSSHIATLAGQLQDGARLENFDLNLGGQLVRSEIHMALQGEGAEAALNGVYLLRGKQHCDNAIQMDHAVGATNSQQDYRGILDDHAHAVFQGKITVRPDAQGIEGHQLNKTLLLSDEAEIDSKPELQILADDVKCSHGATAGELDETGLFYLRSRGIPEDEARQLLMTAFISETLAKIDSDAVRGIMERLVGEWMAA